MHLQVFGTAREASSAVAEIIVGQLSRNPASVLCLPTGGSPLLVHAELRRAYDERRVSFSRATIFILDEYVGIAPDHPSSYAAYMREALLDHVDCPPSQRHIPNGAAADPYQEAVEYERKIASVGGIDLLFLGIGRNSHIAFNEPGSSHGSRTRVVTLAEDTVDANARFFPTRRDVPTRAITMGIGTIMEARRVVLLATGSAKARAVVRSFCSNMNEDCPASALNAHARCDIVVDAEAGRLLGPRRDSAEVAQALGQNQG
jgi:glucosamine-6-phosphate deaminase